MNTATLRSPLLAAVIAAASLTGGCNARTGPGMLPPASQNAAPQELRPEFSVLKMLTKQVVIGSTVDSKFHQLNPYGLDLARATNGAFTAGDLAVCNFNAKSNVQGTGFTVVALHPVPGSKPRLVSSSNTLLGCNALALAPDDTIWAAAFSANDNPVIAANGKFLANIKGPPFDHPFGQAFAAPAHGAPAFYESNAGDGTVVRINLGATFTYDVIARGFPVNHGKPGSIFGPSGLQYDRRRDTLYVVDGTNNSVVAFAHVTSIKAGGIVVAKNGLSFSGPSAASARVVFAGAPLDGPISSGLLYDGNLVVGNTSNPNGRNLLIEIGVTSGKVLAVRNVDKGPAGALFGIVATGTNASDAVVYFNDDNDNDLQALER